MSLRSRIGWGIHGLTQSYYRRKVDSRVLGHGIARGAADAVPPQFVDLYRLARLVHDRKPAVVWEYGSGWSTHFLAQALADNGTGILYSLETDEAWAANTRGMQPPWLQARTDIRYVACDQVQAGAAGACAWKYRWRPPALPQLIYVDGPAGIGECAGNADLIEIELELAPGTLIVLDGRKPTARFLQTAFRRRWRYWEDLGPLGGYLRHFTDKEAERGWTKPAQRYFELQA